MGEIKCEFLMSVSKSNARSDETSISTERVPTTRMKSPFQPNADHPVS